MKEQEIMLSTNKIMRNNNNIYNYSLRFKVGVYMYKNNVL